MSGFRCDWYPSIPLKREGSDTSSTDESLDSSGPATPESSALVALKTERTISEEPSSNTPPLAICPSQPYNGNDSRNLKFFIDVTSVLVSRSQVGPQFWRTLVPQAAWNYPSIRHAMLAAAISTEALISRPSENEVRKALDLQVLTHTSKALQSLLFESVPLDVVLLTSVTLSLLDLLNGQWATACTHITSAAKMARAAQADRTSQPFIAYYCEALARALPSILRGSGSSNDKYPPEENSLVRLDESVRSLRLAKASFQETIPKVEVHNGVDRERIMVLLMNASTETDWILQRWEKLLHEEWERTSAPDDILKFSLHCAESPCSAIMAELNAYLDQGGPFDITKFEIAMERSLPLYTLAKSGPNIKMREVAVELMYLGAQMRGRRGRALPKRAFTSSPTIGADYYDKR